MLLLLPGEEWRASRTYHERTINQSEQKFKSQEKAAAELLPGEEWRAFRTNHESIVFWIRNFCLDTDPELGKFGSGINHSGSATLHERTINRPNKKTKHWRRMLQGEEWRVSRTYHKRTINNKPKFKKLVEGCYCCHLWVVYKSFGRKKNNQTKERI